MKIVGSLVKTNDLPSPVPRLCPRNVRATKVNPRECALFRGSFLKFPNDSTTVFALMKVTCLAPPHLMQKDKPKQ